MIIYLPKQAKQQTTSHIFLKCTTHHESTNLHQVLAFSESFLNMYIIKNTAAALTRMPHTYNPLAARNPSIALLRAKLGIKMRLGSTAFVRGARSFLESHCSISSLSYVCRLYLLPSSFKFSFFSLFFLEPQILKWNCMLRKANLRKWPPLYFTKTFKISQELEAPLKPVSFRPSTYKSLFLKD